MALVNKHIHLARLESTLARRFGKVPAAGVPREWVEFPLSWLCYGVRETAVRESSPMSNGLDVLSGVMDMFLTYHRSIVDEAAEKTGIKAGAKNSINVYVQPDAVNQCTVLVVQRAFNHIVYLAEMKARQFWFDSPADMEADMDEEYNAILRSLR
jgi:hypothetical protein